MALYTMYWKDDCSFCDAAKKLIEELNLTDIFKFRKIEDLYDDQKADLKYLMDLHGWRSAPMILETHSNDLIGGYVELKKLFTDKVLNDQTIDMLKRTRDAIMDEENFFSMSEFFARSGEYVESPENPYSADIHSCDTASCIMGWMMTQDESFDAKNLTLNSVTDFISNSPRNNFDYDMVDFVAFGYWMKRCDITDSNYVPFNEITRRHAITYLDKVIERRSIYVGLTNDEIQQGM